MQNNTLLPPLRLILNTDCNGVCYFCHHEGCYSVHKEMPIKVLNECIEASKLLNIQRISLTGGEPTLRSDLPLIIREIKDKLPTIELSITTNGFNLASLEPPILDLIDKINLSLISFNEEVYKNYQRVDPIRIFRLLHNYAEKTTVNIVVLEDNREDITDIVDQCIENGFCVDLMFELVKNDIVLQTEVLERLTKRYGVFSINYSSTPVMMLNCVSGKRIRIKAPFISKILTRNICKNCSNRSNCNEKVCGLRVYPNGNVTPCLDSFIQSSKATVLERIEDLYPQLDVSTHELYSYFIR